MSRTLFKAQVTLDSIVSRVGSLSRLALQIHILVLVQLSWFLD